MVKKKKKTVGQVITEQREKNDNYYVNVNELTDELFAKKWEEQLTNCINDARSHYKGTFYISVLFKQERLLNEIQRLLFIARRTCPTPTFDQTVYRFDDEGLHFLWTLPSKYLAYQLKNNMLFTPDEEKELLGYVLDFFDGKLDELCRRENKEEISLGPVPLVILKGDAHA